MLAWLLSRTIIGAPVSVFSSRSRHAWTVAQTIVTNNADHHFRMRRQQTLYGLDVQDPGKGHRKLAPIGSSPFVDWVFAAAARYCTTAYYDLPTDGRPRPWAPGACPSTTHAIVSPWPWTANCAHHRKVGR